MKMINCKENKPKLWQSVRNGFLIAYSMNDFLKSKKQNVKRIAEKVTLCCNFALVT